MWWEEHLEVGTNSLALSWAKLATRLTYLTYLPYEAGKKEGPFMIDFTEKN